MRSVPHPVAALAPTLSRRSFAFLTAGAVALGTAGCARDEGPDELEAPWAAARADAATAAAAAGASPDVATRLTPVAEARRAHADALGAEIRRARPDRAEALDAPPPATPPVADPVAALRTSLVAARDAASTLAVTTARYRAGLVASVAASCAGWAEALT
ncbi:hypothetical protein [Actinomycetospora termitidis]|uniref:Uncharacterized protein n=1 Tax=Actinomycetospora termitidis TaxID=3053470 RepID=A0ABT7M920_9PSEU|nr:hypothetical protein [Actinomycetospora sp. Odt1-22]MDL5156287.1 hypothetical protein [Actinomycetospora sp. Odt1-22]